MKPKIEVFALKFDGELMYLKGAPFIAPLNRREALQEVKEIMIKKDVKFKKAKIIRLVEKKCAI
jgi:hypothetical protein